MSQDQDRKRSPSREITSATSTLLASQARMKIEAEDEGPDDGPDLETIDQTLEEMQQKNRGPRPE